MDALATSGIRFDQSYCAAPVCGPSRACVATGRLPHENGVLESGMSILPNMPTMGEIFRAADYHTAWSGRWDLPDHGPDIPGFDCLHDTSQRLGLGMFGDSHVADCAIDFLTQDHDIPFLLGVSLCNPHDICYWVMQQSTPPGKLHPERARLKEISDSLSFNFPTEGVLPPLPSNFAIDPDEPEFIGICRRRPYYGESTFTWDWDEQTWRRYLHAYYRLTEMVDIEVGRVLAALHASGQSENTLVILTSDHGEGMAAHQWVAKLGLYEEPLCVPLILSQPGIIPPGSIDNTHLASGIDILPTMCDYASIPCPEVTGNSLHPVVGHPDLSGTSFLVSELHSDPNDLKMQGRMVRTESYKYVAFSTGKNPEQLFDLNSDPGETRNLSLDANWREELEEHRNLLHQWCEDTDDSFTCPIQ